MAFKWVQARIAGIIDSEGKITAHTSNFQGMDTPRPRDFDDSGAARGVFGRLWHYQETGEFVPGSFVTLGYMGGATAMLVRTSALELLTKPLTEKLKAKYGPMGDLMYLAEVRNTGAPTIWNVAEPSGGMAEDFNLVAEQMSETVELGVYQEDGWLRFLLPVELAECQNRLDEEQRLWWNVVRPDFPCRYEAQIRFMPIGQDTLDNRPGIIVVGPVGDFTHQAIAFLDLPDSGWRVLDTENRPGNPEKDEPAWIALNRKIVGVSPRPDKSPIMYEFAAEGGLDHCGLHLALSGEAIEFNISHLSRAVLGPRGLGWLKEGRR